MSPLLIWCSSLESLQDRLRWREKVPHWCISFGTSWRGFLSLWSDFRGKYIIHSFVDMGLKVRMTMGRCKKRRFNPYFPFFLLVILTSPLILRTHLWVILSFLSKCLGMLLTNEVSEQYSSEDLVASMVFMQTKASNLLSLLHSLNTQLSLY